MANTPQEDKIVVSSIYVQRLVEVLKSEKEEYEEKVLDLECQIEDLEKSLQSPVIPFQRKATEIPPMSMARIKALISKHSGLTQIELTSVLAEDINLDITDKVLFKRLKQIIYQHIHTLKRKDEVYEEYINEKAAYIYYPKESNQTTKTA